VIYTNFAECGAWVYNITMIRVRSSEGRHNCLDTDEVVMPAQNSSARGLAQHFLASVPMIKDIFQRKLGLKNSCGAGYPIFCPPPKKLFVLKHQRRCYEFYTSRKSTFLKESEQVTSLGPNIPIPIRPQNYSHDR
jgi:hypothetical protein